MSAGTASRRINSSGDHSSKEKKPMTPQRKLSLFYLCACIGYALVVVGFLMGAK